MLDISLSIWDIRITNSSISFEQWVCGQDLCYLWKMEENILKFLSSLCKWQKNHELLELNCGWPISLIFTSLVPAASSFTLCPAYSAFRESTSSELIRFVLYFIAHCWKRPITEVSFFSRIIWLPLRIFRPK